MRTQTVRLVVTGALLLSGASAWAHFGVPVRLHPTSKLIVSGTSTVRSFECQAKALSVTAEALDRDFARAVANGDKGIGSVVLTVPTRQLDCANNTMNGHMLKALKAGKYPDIEFRLASYTLSKTDDGVAAELSGELTLGGVERPIVLEATMRANPDGTLSVAGSYELRMTDYGLQPPTLMLGTLKVGETVTVRFDLLLKP
jgi:polyisoprenoid-binding protein YceI